MLVFSAREAGTLSDRITAPAGNVELLPVLFNKSIQRQKSFVDEFATCAIDRAESVLLGIFEGHSGTNE